MPHDYHNRIHMKTLKRLLKTRPSQQWSDLSCTWICRSATPCQVSQIQIQICKFKSHDHLKIKKVKSRSSSGPESKCKAIWDCEPSLKLLSHSNSQFRFIQTYLDSRSKTEWAADVIACRSCCATITPLQYVSFITSITCRPCHTCQVLVAQTTSTWRSGLLRRVFESCFQSHLMHDSVPNRLYLLLPRQNNLFVFCL